MTNQSGDNEIRFTEAHMTPEQREQDRWLTMARCSRAMMAANSAGERMACVETILDRFGDVPDQQPSQQDTAAYARFAAKLLLQALIRQEAASVAAGNVVSVKTENVFNEWIDEWLPPPRAARTTRPRM